jgi:hypothetical protein
MTKIMTKTVYVRDARGRTIVLRPGDVVPAGVRVNPKLVTDEDEEQAVAEEDSAESGTSLKDHTKAELVEMAKARGLPVSGNKQDLIERLGDG